MPQPAKNEWEPCAVCGEPNGAIIGKHVTPPRFGLDSLVIHMTLAELARYEAAYDKRGCNTCRSRLNMRARRARRAAQGLPANTKRSIDWKGAGNA